MEAVDLFRVFMALYNATSGPSWYNNSGWGTNVSICKWAGIYCIDSQPWGLYLTSNNLIGTIPPELGELSKLRDLGLALNSLSGTIPPGLGNMSSLANLWLGDNDLLGTIPPELGRLTQLKELMIPRNMIKGGLPQGIINLPLLARLSLEENNLEGTIPEVSANRSRLQNVWLQVNSFTGTLPRRIGGSDLQEVLVSQNKLTGTLPIWGDATKLIKIGARTNMLSGTIPRDINKYSRLESFSLYENHFTGTIPDTICDLGSLQILHLQQNLLKGSLPAAFGQLRKLDRLDISNNQLTGYLPQSLINNTMLGEFRLFGNENITGDIVEVLERVPKLVVFDASYTNLFSVGTFSLSHSSLNVLNLSHCNITGTLAELEFPTMVLVDITGNQLDCPYPAWQSNVALKRDDCAIIGGTLIKFFVTAVPICVLFLIASFYFLRKFKKPLVTLLYGKRLLSVAIAYYTLLTSIRFLTHTGQTACETLNQRDIFRYFMTWRPQINYREYPPPDVTLFTVYIQQLREQWPLLDGWRQDLEAFSQLCTDERCIISDNACQSEPSAQIAPHSAMMLRLFIVLFCFFIIREILKAICLLSFTTKLYDPAMSDRARYYSRSSIFLGFLLYSSRRGSIVEWLVQYKPSVMDKMIVDFFDGLLLETIPRTMVSWFFLTESAQRGLSWHIFIPLLTNSMTILLFLHSTLCISRQTQVELDRELRTKQRLSRAISNVYSTRGGSEPLLPEQSRMVDQSEPEVEYQSEADQPAPEPEPGADYQPGVYQPQPVVASQPEPAVEYQPEPAVEYQPEPAVEYQPEPAVEYQPEPAVAYQPEPAVAYQHEPVVEYRPEPAGGCQSELEVASHPEPAAMYHLEPGMIHQPELVGIQPELFGVARQLELGVAAHQPAPTMAHQLDLEVAHQPDQITNGPSIQEHQPDLAVGQPPNQ